VIPPSRSVRVRARRQALGVPTRGRRASTARAA
jgi:hypothetical protein